jgi:hypothetical protein
VSRKVKLMSIGVSLAIIALGAIFSFAVDSNPPGLNLDVVGIVLMTVGGVGLYLRMTGYGPEANLVMLPRAVSQRFRSGGQRFRGRRTRIVEERVYDPMAEDPTVYRPATEELTVQAAASDGLGDPYPQEVITPTPTPTPTVRPVNDTEERRI